MHQFVSPFDNTDLVYDSVGTYFIDTFISDLIYFDASICVFVNP